MNLLRIFDPTAPHSQGAPPAPRDAPLRPGYKTLRAIPAASLLFVLLVFFTEFYPFFWGISALDIMVSLIGSWLQWRHYERVGWYEHFEVVRPELPFKTQGERIVFGEETITFSAFLERDFIIRYDKIVGVQTECAEECLSGVTIWFERKPYERKGYWNPNPDSKLISEYGNGERPRTVIAILRAKAPEAAFAGPQWVEDDWVPRQGFTHPNSNP
ncbi:MAG: hypothetical protein EOO38_11270 [Cytophagaceae bacterium]|nr:MAG: hypothetical protein EOO38_11270 [Cytophagaceae bacterium]